MYVSSAKGQIEDETARSKSLMYTKNNIGPNTNTSGTLVITWTNEDIAPSVTTGWVWFFKKFSIHLRFLSLIA